MVEPIKKIKVIYRGITESIDITKIQAFRSEDKATIVIHGDNESLISDSLVSMEKRLPDFIRIHRNALVRRSLVKRLSRDRTDSVERHFSLIIGNERFRVSRKYLKQVRTIISAGSQKQKAAA